MCTNVKVYLKKYKQWSVEIILSFKGYDLNFVSKMFKI